MEKTVWTKKDYLVVALRILLVVASIIMMLFIFSNSLKAGEESSAQSSEVVEVVQKVAAVIAPDSEIANATGEAYDKLHGAVRVIAHICEFTALGILFSWCASSYTLHKKVQIYPCAAMAGVAVVDEILQSFLPDRAFEFTDILLDIFGGAVGIAVAVLLVWCGCVLYRKSREKRAALAQTKE